MKRIRRITTWKFLQLNALSYTYPVSILHRLSLADGQENINVVCVRVKPKEWNLGTPGLDNPPTTAANHEGDSRDPRNVSHVTNCTLWVLSARQMRSTCYESFPPDRCAALALHIGSLVLTVHCTCFVCDGSTMQCQQSEIVITIIPSLL